MYATERRLAVLILASASWAAGGCASTSAPRGFLPAPSEAGSDAYGSWIDVTIRGEEPSPERIRGELIAMTADSTWILTNAGGRAFPTSALVAGQLTTYDSRARDVGTTTVIGVISTISNGYFLILTAPMWLIGGSLATSYQSKIPNQSVATEPPASLGRFARFPAGLPPGVVLGDLEPKPLR